MSDLSEFVVLHDTTLTTDSKRVAKHFRKQHKNVLQAYDRLECSEEFNRLNFQPVIEQYRNGKGGMQEQRVIRMTKDGFMFLVMSFTGKEAARIKESYINAFNQMADSLQRIGDSLWRQRLELETRDAHSFAKASIGAHFMLDRKRELPEIREGRERLDHVMQPALFLAGEAA
jgi:Rha family phage regulatory protein